MYMISLEDAGSFSFKKYEPEDSILYATLTIHSLYCSMTNFAVARVAAFMALKRKTILNIVKMISAG